MSAIAPTVQAYLEGLDADWRRLADGEWGLSLDAAGWPLHVGVALRDGLLRVQAEALAPDRVADHELLHRNRGLRLVRYAHAGDGTVWVQGEVPEAAVDSALIDRLLGAVVGAAIAARERAGPQAA
ncbi:MAG: hypothetical protein H0T43_07250 [Solirubrobacterales bacterium]|nr:hypothetical protein [Solirubrobacterales bacterium]